MSACIKKDDKYMSTVKVGPKGQIVIPKEVRDMFNISPGDTLLLLADAERGIGIEHGDTLKKISDSIFSQCSKNTFKETKDKDASEFANALNKIRKDIK